MASTRSISQLKNRGLFLRLAINVQRNNVNNVSTKKSHTWFPLILSAYEVKNNSCLFERLFKIKKNGVFLYGISFFVLEIFTFLYYANEESDDVIDRSTKTVQHLIKNISGNIKTVFLKLGTRNVHHKRNIAVAMTTVMPLALF